MRMLTPIRPKGHGDPELSNGFRVFGPGPETLNEIIDANYATETLFMKRGLQPCITLK